ncbi:MAG TPA: helix-turn-helix domain-containing protein [Acidimicrobiales bacterium]|nr:helix-turn-helix domain-containing protein [Acidimicrobiales bacterium]
MALPVPASNDVFESTRDKLLGAATEVFSERGYDGAGVQEIARRAGLTTGAIYANFAGKADLLFEAIGARSADELDDLLRPARAALTAGQLLAELGSHLLDEPRGDDAQAGLLIEAFVAARRDGDLSSLVRSLIDERATSIGAIVEQAKSEGSVGADVDADALTRFALVLALGSLLYTSIGIDRPDQAAWGSLIRRIVRSFQEDHTT